MPSSIRSIVAIFVVLIAFILLSTSPSLDKKYKDASTSIETIYLSNYISYKSPNEKYVLYVWIDIQCSHCSKVFRLTEQYNKLGITLRYLPLPIKKGSHDDMVDIWCSSKPKEELDRMKKGVIAVGLSNKLIEKKQCNVEIENNMKAYKQLGLRGTPAFLLPGNIVHYGFVSPKGLIAILDSVGGDS